MAHSISSMAISELSNFLCDQLFGQVWTVARDQNHVSCIGRQILYHCTTWEAPLNFLPGSLGL